MDTVRPVKSRGGLGSAHCRSEEEQEHRGAFPLENQCKDDLGGFSIEKSGVGVVSGLFPRQNMAINITRASVRGSLP